MGPRPAAAQPPSGEPWARPLHVSKAGSQLCARHVTQGAAPGSERQLFGQWAIEQSTATSKHWVHALERPAPPSPAVPASMQASIAASLFRFILAQLAVRVGTSSAARICASAASVQAPDGA